MIRKGRKPTPRSEEERLQQEKEKEESQLRKAVKRNAAKRAKREPKFNMGPVLGHAKELTKKSVTNNQERQLKQQPQQSSHKTQPRYNTKSSSSAGNEDLDCLVDPEGMDQARVYHSYANENTVNSSVFDQGSKENAIQQLREKLKELMITSELEANQAIADSVSPEIKEKKNRKSEEKDLDCLWTDVESLAFKAFEHHHGIRGFSCKNCGDQSNQIINCLDCSEKLCGKCDEKTHLRIPFHQRSFYSNTRPGKQLLPTEFVDHQGQIVVKSVFIPLRSPKCDKCDTHMSQIASYPFHAVVTPKGRFDLNRTIFHCDNCSTNREADFTDFITSGYFPGSPVSTKYLFSFDLLRLWRHLKYLTPGTSEFKFLETIMAISADLGRRGTINKKLFNKASKLYEYFNSLLDEYVKGKRKTICRACTDKFGKPCPLGLHCDGCHKCVRRYTDKKKKGKAWFGDKLIVASENAKKVKDEINLVRPPGKNTISSKCGNSQFLAAREVSTKYKKLEATGMVMASCGHDVVHTAVEMREGETFRDTFAAHIKCRDFNAKFLINDVICQYWDFARNIGILLPKYKYLTENMSPFLSYVHGQAHGWYCQVLYFGHWKEGACMLLGEETERVFSIYGPFQNSTKCMSEGNWIDFFTCAGFYINERKEWNIPRIITIRMFKAVAGLKFYTARFQMLLDANQLTEEDLPAIQEELIKEAFEYKSGSKRKTTTDISTLQDELEWLHYEWINVKNRVSAVAEGCKWRTKLRRKQGTLYASAGKKILEINKLISKTRPKTAEFVNQDLEGTPLELITIEHLEEGQDLEETPLELITIEHLEEGQDLEETPLELITIEHFEEGIFPWEPASLRPYKEKFKLVDCWHKRDRNKEQIELSFLEMSQFITSVGCSINSLTTEINELKHKLSTDEILLAHIFLKAQEIRRLEPLREVALSYAKFYRKDVVAEEVPQFLDDEEDDDEIQEDDDEMEEEEDEMQEDEAD